VFLLHEYLVNILLSAILNRKELKLSEKYSLNLKVRYMLEKYHRKVAKIVFLKEY